jgi:hypothetical protein
LFADGQVLLSDPEEDLQIAPQTSYNSAKQFGIKISPLKFKSMEFKGQA